MLSTMCIVVDNTVRSQYHFTCDHWHDWKLSWGKISIVCRDKAGPTGLAVPLEVSREDTYNYVWRWCTVTADKSLEWMVTLHLHVLKLAHVHCTCSTYSAGECILILVMVVCWSVSLRLHHGIEIHRCLRLLFTFTASATWLAPSTPFWISHTSSLSKSERSDKLKGGGITYIVIILYTHLPRYTYVHSQVSTCILYM